MGDVVKNGVCTMVGVIGSLIASQFGGWDAALSTLILFMAVDYITGLVVAGVFHASPKTKSGTLEGPVPKGRNTADRAGGLQAGCRDGFHLCAGCRCDRLYL